MTRIEAEWRQHASGAVIEAQGPSPFPLPNQDVIALCNNSGSVNDTSLFRYDLVNSTWEVELLDADGSMFMHGLAGDNVLVLSGFNASGNGGIGRWQTGLWNGDRLVQLLDVEEQGLSLGQTDPSGGLLMLYTGINSDAAPGAALIDLDSCPQGDCDLIPVDGLPLWSPGGSLSLLVDIASLGQGTLVLANRNLLLDPAVTVGWGITLSDRLGEPFALAEDNTGRSVGTSPFWMSDSAFGFVRRSPLPEREDREELVLMSAETGLPDVVWDMQSLLSATGIPDSAVGGIVDVMAMANPADDDGVLVVVRDSREDALTVIAIDITSGESTVLLSSAVRVGGTVGTSPEGRWLTVAGIAPGLAPEHAGKGVIHLVDLTGSREPYRIELQAPSAAFGPAYDWSANGEWLVVTADQHTLNLITPEHDYHHLIPYPYDMCSSVAWLNR